MHKKIPVADVEIDSETANILSIPKLHNIEHIPIGFGVNDWWLGRSIKCKPFKTYFSEQIELVNSFDWINFNALKDIDDEFREIYKPSKYMDKMRIDKLLFSLKKRIEMLNQRGW